MKERPILFNADMVIAILKGHKTQTRRVIKPQPYRFCHIPQAEICGWSWNKRDNDCPCGINSIAMLEQCPHGQIGDRLWVKETHARDKHGQEHVPVYYMADGPLPTLDERHDAGLLRKYPSIYMPRWASRITLEITDVRVEQVQDISLNDQRDEGVHAASEWTINNHKRTTFAFLWDNINDKRGFGWDSNPWVWVVEFEVK
jgi:hypothetical protein